MVNVPKLRFPEFSGEWEKKKLKDVGNSVIGLTYSPNDISDKGYLVLRACNIKDNQLSFNDQVFVNIRIPEKLTVRKGDILICARSGSQHLIGKNAYIEKDYPNYTFGAFMCVFRCDESAFVFQGFQTARIKRQIFENQGARINQITTANINAFSMYFPGIKEQTKIANFLTLFDKKIEKQAEKVAALEEYKKGLMQNIFSREIRFKDDEGQDYPEWLWVPLSEVAIKILDRNSDSQITNVITNSAVKGLIKQRDYFDKNIANDENINNYSIIKYGDFVYNPRRSNEAPYGPIKMYKSDKQGIVSPIYLCFRLLKETDLNMNFLAYYFYSNSWYAYIHYFADRGARHDRVSMQDSRFFQMKIPKPAPKEQTKIANFLTLFDRKIEKEKAKLEALREQKKGLLQQMFV